MTLIDGAVSRVLKPFLKLGIFDEERPDNFYTNVSTPAQKDLSEKFDDQTTILLKNKKNVLPLELKQGKNYLVIGNDAAHPDLSGGGSG